MKYVIKIGELGFYSGRKSYAAVPRKKATIFDDHKSAARQCNRLNGRLLKGTLGDKPAHAEPVEA